MRWVVPAFFAFALGACDDTQSIDGSKVPATGASCPEVCTRLASLCGFAPPNCADEEAGYCATNLSDTTVLGCMSTAPSCQAAWECTGTVTTPYYDAGIDAPDETSSGDASPD